MPPVISTVTAPPPDVPSATRLSSSAWAFGQLLLHLGELRHHVAVHVLLLRFRRNDRAPISCAAGRAGCGWPLARPSVSDVDVVATHDGHRPTSTRRTTCKRFEALPRRPAAWNVYLKAERQHAVSATNDIAATVEQAHRASRCARAASPDARMLAHTAPRVDAAFSADAAA